MGCGSSKAPVMGEDKNAKNDQPDTNKKSNSEKQNDTNNSPTSDFNAKSKNEIKHDSYDDFDPEYHPHYLIVRVNKAENLLDIGNRPPDSYLTFEIKDVENSMVKTRCVKQNNNPVFNEVLQFPVKHFDTDLVIVNMWDKHDKKNIQDIANEIEIPTKLFRVRHPVPYEIDLQLNDRNAGVLYLEFEATYE